MHTVHVEEVAGTRFPAPHARTIKHLVAPWTTGSTHLWLGVSEVDAGSSSNPHRHPRQEEIFVVLEGSGIIAVDGVSVPVRPGSVVLVAPGEQHQLISTAAERLRVLSAVAPPFSAEDFAAAHRPAEANFNG